MIIALFRRLFTLLGQTPFQKIQPKQSKSTTKPSIVFVKPVRRAIMAVDRKGFSFSERSINNMKGVHPDLRSVFHAAITLTEVDFVITEGLRSFSRQQELHDNGATKTMNSRHLTGHAMDVVALVGGEVRWDWPLYEKIATAVKAAANLQQIDVEWGGDWTSFKDGPHFQLPWDKYPA